MASNPRINRFQSVVKKFVVEKVPVSEDEEPVPSVPFKISRPAPKKATTLGFVPKNEEVKLPGFHRQQTLAAKFVNNLKANKENKESKENADASPPSRRANKLRSFVNVFMKTGKKQSPVSEQKLLGFEEIKKKFSRAFQILRVLHRLNRISEDIQLYGTSSNLFDLTTRDRTRVKKILYPSVLNEHEDQLNEEKGMSWYVVHPKSRFRAIWSIIMIILLIYTATVMPYRTAFENTPSDSGKAIDYAMDILFLVDLVMNFVSAYYDDEGKLVKEPRILANTYLKSWFIIDLVAVFPFDLIQDVVISDEGSSSHFASLVKLLRLSRLYKLIRLLKIKHFFKFLRGTKVIEWIELHSVFVKLFGFLVGVIILVHIMACIWYFMAKMDSDDPKTWVAREQVMESDVDDASIYITSLYYIFSTLATVGYGDITSGTIAEQVFSIVLMLLGVAIYSFTIGMSASLLSSRENRESALKRKVSIANEFAHEIKAPRSLKAKITKILEYNSFRNCFSWANKKDIFSEIPITLRYEIVMKMHNGILTSIPFFREHSDKYFVVTIAEILKPLRIKGRSYLWKEGDSSESMYFLITGKVHLISYEYLSPGDRANNQKTAIIFKRFMSGSYFGEIELINKRKRNYSLQVNTESELFYLTKHDYFSIIVAEFPHIHEEFKEIATERDKRNGESLVEIRKFLQANLPEERKSIRVARHSLLRPNMNVSMPVAKPDLKHTSSIEFHQTNLDRILNLSSDQKDHTVPEIKLKNLVKTLPPIDVSMETKLRKTPSNHSQGSGSLSPPAAMSRKRLEDGKTSRSSSPSQSLSKILYTSSEVSSETNTDVKSRSGSRSQSPVTTPKAKKSILKKREEITSPKSGAVLPRTYSFSSQKYHRSKTSVVLPIIPDSATKKNSVRLSAHLKPGTVLSSVDLDSKKRKGSRSKERSLLKLIVGADSDSDDSTHEAVGTLDKLKMGSETEIKGRKGSTDKDVKGSSSKKVDGKAELDGLVEIEKMKKRGRKKADNIKSELKDSNQRMKGLEKQLGKLMNDMQELMEGA